MFWLVGLYVNLSPMKVFAFLSSLKYKINQCKIKYKILMYTKEYANVQVCKCASTHMCNWRLVDFTIFYDKVTSKQVVTCQLCFLRILLSSCNMRVVITVSFTSLIIYLGDICHQLFR